MERPTNPGAEPDAPSAQPEIAVAARQDGSGTTFALANHLAAISPAWREGPGVGYLIDWGGRAMRARGNEGVASLIKLGEGTIGYVEYGFAKRLGLAMAHLENKAGQYVAPGDRSGQTALASNVKQMPTIFGSTCLTRMGWSLTPSSH